MVYDPSQTNPGLGSKGEPHGKPKHLLKNIIHKGKTKILLIQYGRGLSLMPKMERVRGFPQKGFWLG